MPDIGVLQAELEAALDELRRLQESLSPERPEAVEAWAAALRPAMVAQGLDDPESNQSYHGWRCKYPESYGQRPCDCFDVLVKDLAAALLRARAEAERP
jgi:hypothetical protein